LNERRENCYALVLPTRSFPAKFHSNSLYGVKKNSGNLAVRLLKVGVLSTLESRVSTKGTAAPRRHLFNWGRKLIVQIELN
jgi:hypothetical protein